MNKLVAGFSALVSPKNSEFWAGLTALGGWIATTGHWVAPDTWEKWGPGLVTYVGARFISKAAKS